MKQSRVTQDTKYSSRLVNLLLVALVGIVALLVFTAAPMFRI